MNNEIIKNGTGTYNHTWTNGSAFDGFVGEIAVTKQFKTVAYAKGTVKGIGSNKGQTLEIDRKFKFSKVLSNGKRYYNSEFGLFGSLSI